MCVIVSKNEHLWLFS